MKNIIVGVFCLALVGVAFLSMTTFPDAEVSYKDPAAYPRVILVCIAALAVVLVVMGVRERKRPQPEKAEASASAGIPNLRTPLIVFGVSVVYFAVMQLIGFITASFVFLLVVYLIFGGKPRQGIIFAAAMTIGEYLLFVVFLRVRLPGPIISYLNNIL